MSIDTMSFVFGGLLVAVSILGGGIEIRELKIPAVNSTSRMLAFVAGALFVGLAVLLRLRDESGPPAPSPATENGVVTPAPAAETGWLTSAQYQKKFDSMLAEGFYPSKVEGRCEKDAEQFKGEWQAMSLSTAFVSRHGITKDSYAFVSSELTEKGYELKHLYIFKDCGGLERYQATWTYRF